MAILVGNGYGLFLPPNSTLGCFSLKPLPNHFFTDRFVSYLDYIPFFQTLSDLIDRECKNFDGCNSFILESDLYFLPGFIESFREWTKKAVDIYWASERKIAESGLQNGDYHLIDILRYSTFDCNVTLVDENISVNNVKPPGNSVAKALYNSFASYILQDVTEESIANTLFSYPNAFAVNDILINPKYSINGNKTSYLRRNLYFPESPFKLVFSSDLELGEFFKIIITVLSSQLKQYEQNAQICINSPLTAYLGVHELMLDPIKGVRPVSSPKMEFVTERTLINSKSAGPKGPFYLDTYLGKQPIDLPLSCWMLSDTTNMHFDFSTEIKSHSIDLAPLRNDIANSCFELNGMSLLKYGAQLTEDGYGNLTFGLKDLNGNRYFKQIYM